MMESKDKTATQVTPESSGGDTSQAKRISKNSLYLVVRTLLIMIVSLYTSRVTLEVLGEEDYGIYTLVAGFVLFFGFINISMERGTSRFLMYERGVGNPQSMMAMFNTAVYAHASIAIVVLLLGETVGLWYVNTHLNIPADKMTATNWVYQLALVTLMFNVMKVPYNASIVAHEKMSFYAILAMVEVVLRLGAIMALYLLHDHLLVVYALQFLGVTVVVFICYRVYCKRNFPSCRFRWIWNKKQYFDLLSFSGWSTLGGAACIFAFQGVGIVLNLFIGVVANAAMGLATNVYNAMFSVLSSFQTAYSPRLVGLYAQEKFEELRKFIYTLGKFSFFIGAALTVPVCLNMSMLLHIWLGNEVPEYTSSFSILILAANFFDCIAAPGLVCNQASGKVRNFNIIWSILLLCNLGGSYVALKLGASAPMVFVIRTVLSGIIYLFVVIVMRVQIGLRVMKYVAESLLKPLLIFAAPFALTYWIYDITGGWGRLMLTSVAFEVSYIAVFYVLGLRRGEREMVKDAILTKLKLKKKTLDAEA